MTIGQKQLSTYQKSAMSSYWHELRKDLRRDWQLYLLLSFMVIWYLIFIYRPLSGLQIAFKDYNKFLGIEVAPWVGLKHFRNFIGGPYFGVTIKNTLIISLYSLLFEFPMPIILALMFNELTNRRFKKLAQTATYLPHFISVVIIAGLVTNFLSPSSGVVNIARKMLDKESIYFLSRKEFFRPILVSMNIWKETGFSAIVYIAALSGISLELYEAARIDGAGKWSQILNVTIPGILPTITIMLIMRIGSLLNVSYETIILLYQPATYETADVLSTFMYRTGLSEGKYDIATAIGFFQSAVGFVLVVLANQVSRHVSETSLW